MSGGRHFRSNDGFPTGDDATQGSLAPHTTDAFPQEGPAQSDFYDYYFSHDHGGAHGGGRRTRRRRGARRRKRIIIITVVCIVVALVAVLGSAGFMLVSSARSMQSQAKTIMSVATSAKDKLAAGDFSSMPDDARQIQSLCSKINDEINGPLWSVASGVPVVGGDVSAARTLTGALSSVASEALVPVADSLAQSAPGKLLQDGSVNVSAVQALADALSSSGAVFERANESVQAIGATHVSQVTWLVNAVKGGFATLDSAAKAANQVASVLPQMLGAGGTRNYLIVAENNAEIRACGGFIGSSGVLSIADGKLSIGEFEPTQIIRDESQRSQISISDEEETLFQPEADTLNYTAGDSLFTPDFPRGAWLASKIWSLRHDDMRIDGVIAVDPVFLQGLLGVVGGVTALDGTEVDGTNAAKALLSDVYWKYPTNGPAQDAVFASVADAAFDKLLNGMADADVSALGEAVSRGVSGGHLLMWMANEDEEACVKTLGIDGALPTDPGDPKTGVFVNNYSYSKLDWYLNIDARKGPAVKNADGTVSYAMSVTLTNTMSGEDAKHLPAYVQAHSPRTSSPAQELLRLYLYAPMGGGISDVTCSSGSVEEASHNGLQVMWRDVFLMPGESLIVKYTVTVPAAGAGKDLDLRVTPTGQGAQGSETQR